MYKVPKDIRDTMIWHELMSHYNAWVSAAARIEAQDGMLSPDEEDYISILRLELETRADNPQKVGK